MYVDTKEKEKYNEAMDNASICNSLEVVTVLGLTWRYVQKQPWIPYDFTTSQEQSGKSVGFWYIKEETEVPPVYVFASTSASMTATVSKPTVTSIHNSVVTLLPTCEFGIDRGMSTDMCWYDNKSFYIKHL